MRTENFQHESDTKLTESDVIFFSAEDVLSFKFSVCIIERESKQNCFQEIIKNEEIKSKKMDVIIK